MWKNETVGVILPTYNEADSIRACIEAFEALGIVDEIVVVNNNAHPDTSPAVASTGAREVHEAIQGYGAAIRRGLAETTTFDLVCICEPDGTLPARPAQAAPVPERRRDRARLAHRHHVHLLRRQHGSVPPLGKLGGRYFLHPSR